MKQITVFIFLFLVLSCTTTRNTTLNNVVLNGTWLPVKETLGDKELPTVLFEKQKLIITESNYTVYAESVDKGIVKYNGNKMDIYGKEGVNKGKHYTAIYKYENEQLTICYNLNGDNYPETFETKGKMLYFLSVFKKEIVK